MKKIKKIFVVLISIVIILELLLIGTLYLYQKSIIKIPFLSNVINKNSASVAGVIIPAATFSTSCSNNAVNVSIYWAGASQNTDGYFIDIDDDNDFDNGYWSKYVLGSATTVGTDTFSHLTSQGAWDSKVVPLVLKSQTTYYSRVYANGHSPTITFVTPNCNPQPVSVVTAPSTNQIIAPTVSSSCIGTVINSNIYWLESGKGSQGYFVDVDDDGNLSNGYWSRYIPAGERPQVSVPVQFSHLTSEGVWDSKIVPLVLKPQTSYYTRIYYGASFEHSPTTIFTTPTCGTASVPISVVPVVDNPPVVQVATGYPELGVNLEALSDYSVSMMFADAMKTARSFSKDLNAPWSNITTVPVDANGWPTTDFAVLVFTGLKNAVGTYKMSFTGKATVDPISPDTTISNSKYNYSTNTSSADISVQGTQLALKFTNTGGSVKNIKIIRPGDTASDIFDKNFLARISAAKVLRLMDYSSTNGSPVRNWADRTKPTDALQTGTMKLIDPITGTYPIGVDGTPIANCTWRATATGWAPDVSTCVPNNVPKGGSVEYMIDLANQTGKDLWINIPSEATDAYVTSLAQLLKQTLRSDLNVYLEYSNEVWNGSFTQQALNRLAAKREVVAGDTNLTDGGAQTSTDYYVAFKRVAKRIVAISNIFKNVYGSAAINTKIRPILAIQYANLDIAHAQLSYVEKYLGTPSKFLYGLAGAPYYAPEGMNDSSTATSDQLIDAMAKNINNYATSFIAFDTLAKAYNLKAISYEGGTDTSGGADNKNKITSANDPRMEELTYKYLSNWYGCGGDLFMYYALAGGNSNYGTWGLTDDIKVVNPKLKGFEKVSQTQANKFICNVADQGTAQRSATLLANPSSGNGLSGQYFSDTSLLNKTYSETTSNIAFDWQNAMPYHSVPESFSVRWTGYVTAPVSGTYNFYTQTGASAGVKLKIDGNDVISDWPTPDPTKSGSMKEKQGSVYFAAGSKHAVAIEFYHQHSYFNNMPIFKLLWSTAGVPKSIVPASQLSH